LVPDKHDEGAIAASRKVVIVGISHLQSNCKKLLQVNNHGAGPPSHANDPNLARNFCNQLHSGHAHANADPLIRLARKFMDSGYNEENFFVRQAYFLGTNDPIRR
jgi:hypothetical protein